MTGRIGLVMLLVTSVAAAQDGRFKYGDECKWATICKVTTDFEQFDLTSNQLDRLLENEILHGRKLHHFNGKGVEEARKHARAYLSTVYEVLDERQQARLHEVMFQVWMNLDDLVTPLLTFEPNEVKGLKAKSAKLTQQISARLKETIRGLPKEQREHQEPLREFLVWRWKLQREWLEGELGKERTHELLGEPTSISYQFVTKGNPKKAGMRPFGDPFGGGYLFNIGHVIWGSSNDVLTITVSVNPATGEIGQRMNLRGNRDSRPVDVPEGLTLEQATRRMELIKEGIKITLAEAEDQIAEVDPRRRVAPGEARVDRQAAYAKVREMEEAAEAEVAIMQIGLAKARAVIVKLGGDPDAKRKSIRAAESLFWQREIVCNRPPFVSHIDATAEQCDRLDEICDRYASVRSGIAPERRDEYYAEVNEVLDEKQQELLRQQLFRHYWYSVDCAKAFPAAGLNVTAEQEQKIAALSTMLTETRKALQGIRMSSMQRRSRLRYSRFDLHREGNEVYLMLKDRFEDTLDELVGTVAAKQLLGDPMQHDRNWKRPVVVPAGMTLEQATAHYDKLFEEQKGLKAKFEKMMDEEAGIPFGGNEAGLDKINNRMSELSRLIELARRHVEELGGSVKQ